MRMNNKGVTLYELLGYIAIVGIITSTIFSLLAVSNRIFSQNKVNNYLINAGVKYIENFDNYLDFDYFESCTSLNFENCIELKSDSKTSTIKLVSHNEYFFLEIDGVTVNSSDYAFSKNSYIKINANTCTVSLCKSGIVDIKLELVDLSSLKSKIFYKTIAK